MEIYLIPILAFFGMSFSQDIYSYDENAASEVVGNSSGIRLVGAARADTSQYPFVVGYTLAASDKDFSSCTGSVISKDWIVSAAHCILFLVDTNDIKACAEETANGQPFTNLKTQGKVKCVITNAEDIHIFPIEPKAFAYIDIANVNEVADVSKGEKLPIEYVVRHKNSYRGGGNYGTFGGYDITLVRLASPTNVEPACLPSSDFKDSSLGAGFDNIQNVMLAGFGRYYRAPCMTDDLGPSPTHYCVKDSKCNTDVNPPVTEECQKLFTDNPEIEKEFSNKNLHKITVSDSSKKFDCFRKTSFEEGSKGWCPVTDDASTIGNIQSTNSWGFCGKDCFLKENENIEPDSSVLRSKEGIDILSDELCNQFLLASYSMITPEYLPEVLCIGYYKKTNIKTFQLSADGNVTNGKDEAYPYVTSAGTCNGDSGGPVFIKDANSGKFVVLGAVSGGRGLLSNCGGMNNPTHYARTSKLVDWIKKAVGSDSGDICIIGNSEESKIIVPDDVTTAGPVVNDLASITEELKRVIEGLDYARPDENPDQAEEEPETLEPLRSTHEPQERVKSAVPVQHMLRNTGSQEPPKLLNLRRPRYKTYIIDV